MKVLESKRAFVVSFLLVCQVAVITAKIASACGSCLSVVNIFLSLAGVLFYSWILLKHVCFRQKISGHVLFGLSLHFVLTAFSFGIGSVCVYCLANTMLAVMLALFVIPRPANLTTVLPAGLMLVSFAAAAGTGIRESKEGLVVTAYVKRGCGYCDKLQRDVLPVLRDEGVDVNVENGELNYSINLFPTIVIRNKHGEKVIEGLVSLDTLRKEIGQLEGNH